MIVGAKQDGFSLQRKAARTMPYTAVALTCSAIRHALYIMGALLNDPTTVRDKNCRDFNETFHVATEQEAKRLCEVLNGKTEETK